MAAPLFYQKGGIFVRVLMWFSLGFVFGCGIPAYELALPAWIPLLLAVSLFFLGHRWKKVCPGAVVSLGCCAGLLWFGLFSGLYLSDARALDGQVVQTRIEITDYSRETNYGCVADGVFSVKDKTYRVCVYVNEVTSLEPGDRVSGTFLFRMIAPGGEDAVTYHAGKGIFLLAYQRGAATFGTSDTENWRCALAKFRQSIRNILSHTFPESTLPFAQALLIGDASLLPYEQDMAFQITGIRHVIAVSGLHVSVLFAIVGMLTFHKRYLMALIGIPVLWVFAAAAGFTPSVSRACLMSGLMLLSSLTEKEYDGPTSLAFAVLAMTTANPMVVTSVGLQLSVCSVAGIFLCYEPVNTWILDKLGREKGRGLRSRMKSGLAGVIAMSLSSCLLTTPLCAYYFGMVSLIGVVTNMLVLWLILPVFSGIIGVCGLYLLLPGAAVILAKIVSIPMVFILGLTKLLAKFSLAAVYTTEAFIAVWLIGTYLGIAVYLLRKSRNPVRFISWVTIGLSAALCLSWVLPRKNGCRITVLDVGQGQCILLQNEGHSFLVDCGGDSDEIAGETAARFLRGQGIENLDGIVLTHYDRDHTGGVPYLLSWVDTEMLILPDTEDRDRRREMPEISGEILLVSDTVTVEYGETKMTVFGPVYSGYSNENSLCILFETENCAILITGDRSGFGERMLLRQVELPDVDILVAGHHGSADSTSEELLDTVTPETVLISVSEDNNYGHPDRTLLQRLEERGCTIYRTDLHGTIEIRR